MSNFYFDTFGLSRKDIKKIIDKHFKENADVLIGVDDPEINQLIDVLVNAFVEVVETNNEQLSEDIKEYIKEETAQKKSNYY